LHLEALEERYVLSPTLLDPNLGVRTVATGLTQPTTMAFLGDNDFFVVEKTTGKVDHVINGVVAPTRFDLGAGPIANLPVNNESERGLLGIALSPNFADAPGQPGDHAVYLYWTESTKLDAQGRPVATTPNNNADLQFTPVLGNRVDRFIWSPISSTLTFDRNIIRLHAFQNDGNGGNPAQMAGNHNGGVIHFGPDGKLYIVIGDNGRRGWMQNLVNGPNGPGQTDENNGPVRGGPAPDNAHLTGVLLRLNPDGSIPDDNPFVDISASFQAPFLSGPDTAGRQSLGSFFTMFLNQAEDTFTIDTAWENLGGPTLDGGASINLGGTDGPSIFAVPDLPGGLTSGSLVTTLTADNFIPEPAFGINTFEDAVNAVKNGQTSFNIYTRQFPGGAISGKIAELSSQVTTNLHKVYAYGIRNTFGFAWDPLTNNLWMEENGDVSFDKISIVGPGSNDGWIQSSSPLFNNDGSFDDTALAEFKSIELRLSPNGLQQTRWKTSNIADTPQEALNRMLMLPGASYNNPVFSVRAEFPPAALGFLSSSALGAKYENALFEGGARDLATSGGQEKLDGALFVFQPNSDRTGIDFNGDPNVRTTDNVFENNKDFDLMGDTSFLLGTGFGVGTDIQTGPNGDLYVVSLTKGEVYEIFRKDAVSTFQTKNLVADDSAAALKANPNGGTPTVIDTSLKNPWGIAFSSTSPFWVTDQRTGVSTLYSGDHKQSDGSVTPISKGTLTVTIPPRAGGAQGSPTGIVRNDTSDFVLANGQPASYIFDGLDGTITAWNTGSTAELKATVPGASYTGLAIGTSSSGDHFLYAANQATGKIDVFDKTFSLTTLDGNFEDPDLPPGSPFKAFNVQDLGGTLYVTYDKVITINGITDREHDGIVDAFDTDGHFLRRVVTGGVNAPWGLAIAPDNFGPFSGALLVGNFGLGDGKINAYDPDTGAFLGNLTDASGKPLALEGLWAIAFGNGGSGGDTNALYFAAGINRTGANSFGSSDGLFGSIRFVDPAS
jgi:uncharacterized protein (TIGR03118 family)